MNHHIFAVNDCTEQVKEDREKQNKRRRGLYYFHKRLSNNLEPFTKPAKKFLRTKKLKKVTNKTILSPEKQYRSFLATSSTIGIQHTKCNESEEYNLIDIFNSNADFPTEQGLNENDNNFTNVRESALFSSSDSDSGTHNDIKLFAMSQVSTTNGTF